MDLNQKIRKASEILFGDPTKLTIGLVVDRNRDATAEGILDQIIQAEEYIKTGRAKRIDDIDEDINHD